MSNTRFIELSSKNRNRVQYPKPAEFEVPFTPPTQSNQLENVKGAYKSNQINVIYNKYNNVADAITNGIIDYTWNNIYDQGQFNYDDPSHTTPPYPPISMGILTVTLNPYYTIANYYKGCTMFITDASSNFIDYTVITSSTNEVNTNYVTVQFSPSMSIVYNTDYTYTMCIDGGQIGSGSTSNRICVTGLSNVYKNVSYFYVGYQLNIYEKNMSIRSSSIITSFDPSTNSIYINECLSFVPTSTMYFMIVDNSTSSQIVLPGIDSTGKTIMDIEQYYNDYYVINESAQPSIVSSKIISYNYLQRSITLETPLSNWNLYDTYSIRRTLPSEMFTTTTLPVLSGMITTQTNYTTIYASGLSSTANYTGFIINVQGYPVNGIASATFVDTPTGTRIVLTTNIDITSFPVAFTITPTFYQVNMPNGQLYPQLSLSSCIFLPSTANRCNGYYAGKYIYIYPAKTQNNQTTPLSNIQGSCYYINAYIGDGYNACYVTNINYSTIQGSTQFYPSYNNINPSPITPGTFINIVSFDKDNYVPLKYNGSLVSQNEAVAYEINLISLTLPNQLLTTGSKIIYYPYVYVEFSIANNLTNGIIYSNNPNSRNALFIVPITNIVNASIPFVKLNCRSMTQTVKFKPNDVLQFSVYLPNGKLFETVTTDYYTPSYPNELIQIDAVFSIIRLSGVDK
jgi:hypothetical protein